MFVRDGVLGPRLWTTGIKMNLLKSITLISFIMLGLVFATTPAGVVITNQAVAQVADETYYSNRVETVVQAVCEPSLSPEGTPSRPGQMTSSMAGGFSYFSYLLTNSGNDNFEFSLTWNQSNASITPSSVRFFLDSNQDGKLDSGELEVSSVLLEAGKSARVIEEIQAPLGSKGVVEVSPIATCADGTADDENFARVNISTDSAILLAKSVSTGVAKAGEEITFTILASHTGVLAEAGPIFLDDDVSTMELAGLTYVENSLVVSRGVARFSDDGIQYSSDQNQAKHLRLELDGLQPGETVKLSYRMLVSEAAIAGTRMNTISMTSAYGVISSSATFAVAEKLVHHLGPLGNAEASGPADHQAKTGFAGQKLCFGQSLSNSGNSADAYYLSSDGAPRGSSVIFETLSGVALSMPVSVSAGAKTDFQTCVVNLTPENNAADITIFATSSRSGQTDPTIDSVLQVLDINLLVLNKFVDLSTDAVPGQRITYTLSVENPLNVSLTSVVLSDVLAPELVYLSSLGVYDPSTRTVRFDVGTIPALSVKTVTLEVLIAENVANGTTVLNRFTLRSDQNSNPLVSPDCLVMVSTAGLLLQKSVDRKEAQVGDQLVYTIKLVNVGKVPLIVDLVDTTAEGLLYIEGSTRFFLNTNPAISSEPEISSGGFTWKGIALGSGESFTVSYSMRLTPLAKSLSVNTVVASAYVASGSLVSQSKSTALVSVRAGAFGAANMLLGRVYLDANENGRFDSGIDFPLEGARLLLSNGVQALSDVQGRYTFRNLTAGPWEVMLDASSSSFEPYPHPDQADDLYRHHVVVASLTTTDFPLRMPTVVSAQYRETELTFGPLQIAKSIRKTQTGYLVTLVVVTVEPLHLLTIRDPLSAGGEKVFEYDLFEGTATIAYEVDDPLLTDPGARWRYP